MAIPVRDFKKDVGYRWQNRDPILDLVCALIDNEGWTPKRLEYACGVTAGTIRNWQVGKTRKPQAQTVKFVLAALGYSLSVMRKDGRVTDVPLTSLATGRRAAIRWRKVASRPIAV